MPFDRLLSPRWLLLLLMATFASATIPGEVQAGPYYKLDPYPIHLRVGTGLESTGLGGVVGGTVHADFKVAYLNERFSVHLGARGHGYMGPLSSNFGETYHYAGFAVVRWQVQVDSMQSVSPYVILGPGFVAYNGHPDRDGNDAIGKGPALETDVGFLGRINPRLSWFAELGLIGGYPRAFYVRFNGGIQFAFGSDGIQKDPF